MIQKAREIKAKVELYNKLDDLIHKIPSYYTELIIRNSITEEDIRIVKIDELKEEILEVLDIKKELVEKEIEELLK